MFKTRMTLLLAAGGVAASLLSAMTAFVGGEEVKHVSFYPPFKSFNARGDRVVPQWTSTGDASVKQSFVRLTPDSPSKTGTMFSRLTTRGASDEGGQFSLALTFRLSGDHDKSHGHHLALVVGKPETLRKRGPTFGFPEDFVGIGVVITTRAPSDTGGLEINQPAKLRQHVSVIANNGTRSTKDVHALASSCLSTVRYLQTRDDFNFLKSSRTRLGFLNGEVTLEIDARNRGVWRKCVSTKILDMPEDWLEKIGVALSATTAVHESNNYDIMSLEFYSGRDEAFDKRKVDGMTSDADGSEQNEARAERILTIQAHMEHEFDAVERILKDSVSKVASLNDDFESRLQEVEKAVSKEALNYLNARVKGIEERVKSSALPALDFRLKSVKREFQDEMGISMDYKLSKAEGWRTPFLVTLLILAAVIVGAIVQYRKLTRSAYLGGYR